MMNASIEPRLRVFMLWLSVLSLATTLAELYLENHTQEAIQWIPWVLCMIGLVAVIAALIRPVRTTLLAMRWAMLVVGLGGLVGISIHLLENFEFERDVHANADFFTNLMSALKGAAPLFAPGTLIFAALLALGAAYAHPALKALNQSSSPQKS